MSRMRRIKGKKPARTYSLDREVTIHRRDASFEILPVDREVRKRLAWVICKEDGYSLYDLGSIDGIRAGIRDMSVIDTPMIYAGREAFMDCSLDISVAGRCTDRGCPHRGQTSFTPSRRWNVRFRPGSGHSGIPYPG